MTKGKLQRDRSLFYKEYSFLEAEATESMPQGQSSKIAYLQYPLLVHSCNTFHVRHQQLVQTNC